MENENENNNERNTLVTNDIIKLNQTLIEKYKDNLGIEILKNMDNESELELKNLIFKIFDLLFGN